MADDHELRYTRRPGPIARMLGGVGVTALVTSLGDQELDADLPQVAFDSRRSWALRRLAVGLVEDGRYEDPDAVVALARAAGRHPRELKRAAASVRSGGRAAEDRTACRVNRLLLAAATGRPVQPVTDDELVWFDRVLRLGATPAEPVPLAVAYAELAAEEPELRALERDVHRATSGPEFTAMDEGRRLEVLAGLWADGYRAVEGSTRAPIVGTQAARHVARGHLHAVAGLPVPGGGGAGR